MTSTGGRLQAYSKTSRGMTWLILGAIVAVFVAWLFMYFIIRLTYRTAQCHFEGPRVSPGERPSTHKNNRVASTTHRWFDHVGRVLGGVRVEKVSCRRGATEPRSLPHNKFANPHQPQLG